MRELRALFALFGAIAAGLALAQHLGFDLWNCATCSFVQAMPMSGVLAWGGPVVLITLAYGLFKEARWAKIGIGLASLVSLGLVAWMISHRTVCLLCMLTHIGVIAAGLASLPKVAWVAAPAFALAVAFTATNGWQQFTVKTGIAIFRPRDGEEIPPGRVLVYFSDPECARCHLVEKQLANLPNRPTILYRWTLLPQNLYRSMRAAALLESVRLWSPELFEKLRADLSNLNPPLTDSVLEQMAAKVVPTRQVLVWMDEPRERALIALEDDRTTSLELGIQSLPALAELSPPDRSGMRTLRRVPFSEIGL